MGAHRPLRFGVTCLALGWLASAPVQAAGDFDGEWRGTWLESVGCPSSRQTLTATVRNYVFASPLARGGFPVIGTIRGDDTINLFWEGDRFLSGRFAGERFTGEVGFGSTQCRFVMRREAAPEPGPAGDYDGAWRLRSVAGCLEGYTVEAAIYISGEEVTGIATGWLTEEFAGKLTEDGSFEVSATRYRLSGRLPLTGDEVEINYSNVGGDCTGTARMMRRQRADGQTGSRTP